MNENLKWKSLPSSVKQYPKQVERWWHPGAVNNHVWKVLSQWTQQILPFYPRYCMCVLLLAIPHHVQAATEGQLSRQRVKHSQLPFGERCLGRKEERQNTVCRKSATPDWRLWHKPVKSSFSSKCGAVKVSSYASSSYFWGKQIESREYLPNAFTPLSRASLVFLEIVKHCCRLAQANNSLISVMTLILHPSFRNIRRQHLINWVAQCDEVIFSKTARKLLDSKASVPWTVDL